MTSVASFGQSGIYLPSRQHSLIGSVAEVPGYEIRIFTTFVPVRQSLVSTRRELRVLGNYTASRFGALRGRTGPFSSRHFSPLGRMKGGILLVNKNPPTPTQSLSAEEYRVGVFWMLAHGELIVDSVPLDEAEAYGDFLTHPRSHIDRWKELQEASVVDHDTEYEELPRGRVGYDMRVKRFFLFADRCILARPAVIKRILAALRLPPEAVEICTDSHYRCKRCLERFPIT
jgi:hypothetical protein